MNTEKIQTLVTNLYSIVGELEAMFPGRHFTPDGHMVGSLGECLVAHDYGLELMPASNQGFDALSVCGKQVEIKATQASSFAFRSEPEFVIAIKILPNGRIEEIYNGPGDLVWRQFAGKKMPKNGQFQISLSKLSVLNQTLDAAQKLPRVALTNHQDQ